MKFLLIGGVGYIGGRLASHLKSQGHYVRLSTRRPPSSIPAWVAADSVVQLDFNHREDVFRALDAIDMVVDLAAPDEVLSARQPRLSIQAGGEQTWALLETVADRSASERPGFIFMSTFHVYGPHGYGEIRETTPASPVHPYAVGRYIGERVVESFRQRYQLAALSVRLSNAFGCPASIDVPRWSLVFNDLCYQAVHQKNLTLKTAGHQERNFITLEDTCRAIGFLAERKSAWPKDGVIHIGSKLQWTILEVAKMVSDCTQRVCGYTPSINAPQTADSATVVKFHFSIDRLKSLGFDWRNNFEEEIRSTLNLYLNSPPDREHSRGVGSRNTI